MTTKPVEYEHNKYFVDPLYIVALIVPFWFWFRPSLVYNLYRLDIVWVLWAYFQASNLGGIESGFFFDTFLVPVAFLMSGFRFVFVMTIRKHQKGLVSQRAVWISAVLSQMPMAAFLFFPLFALGLGGPIPILLVIGLIIDRKIGVEPPVVPWEDESSGIEK